MMSDYSNSCMIFGCQLSYAKYYEKIFYVCVQGNYIFVWYFCVCIFVIMMFNVLCFLELVIEGEASNSCYDFGAMIGSVDDAFGMHSYSYLYVYETFFFPNACMCMWNLR